MAEVAGCPAEFPLPSHVTQTGLEAVAGWGLAAGLGLTDFHRWSVTGGDVGHLQFKALQRQDAPPSLLPL